MRSLNTRLFFAVIVSLSFAIFPLPEAISGWRPPFALMLLLYVQCFLPTYFSLMFLSVLGLCMDALLSTVLGEHVFALVLTTWIFNGKARRFRFFSMGQQILLLGVFCFIYQTALLLVNAFSGFHYSWIMVLASTATGMFFWPWVKVLADDTLLLAGRSE